MENYIVSTVKMTKGGHVNKEKNWTQNILSYSAKLGQTTAD